MKPLWIDHVDVNNWGKLDPVTGKWDGFFGRVGYGGLIIIIIIIYTELKK